MAVLRVLLSNQYFEPHHDYSHPEHTAQVTETGLLYIKKGGKVVRTYSSLAWLDVGKSLLRVDSPVVPQ